MQNLYNKRLIGAAVLVLTLVLAAALPSRAALNKGDIAVIGYNSDAVTSTKDFTVVALATINAGETIYITDKGWTATAGGSFMADITSEGIFQWTVTGTIARGTVINFSVTSGPSPGVVASPSLGTLTVTNGWTSTAAAAPFGTNGDQIIIFQGSPASPTFIFGFNAGISSADVVSGWQTTATTGNALSNIPAGLTNGTNAVGFPTTTVTSLDNYAYKGSFTGSKAAVLALICNTANWDGDDATPYNIVPGSAGGKFPGINPIFSVNSKPTATTVTNGGTLMVGQTLTGNYSYADDDNDVQSGSTFAWYRSDDASGTNKQATGGTGSTYILAAGDVDKYMSFQVTPRDGREFGTAVESPLRGPVVGTLPVRLVEFTARGQEGNLVRLDWKVADSRENRGFEILRRGEQGAGKLIAEMPARAAEQYSYDDRSPLQGNNYYILVQVDNDGTRTELAVRKVAFSLEGEKLAAYPTPTSGAVSVDFAAGRFSRAVLAELSGKTIAKRDIGSEARSTSFDLQSLPSGIYMIRLIGDKASDAVKVVRK